MNLPKNRRVAEYIFSDAMIEIMLRHGLAKDRKLGLLLDCRSEYGVEPDSVDMIDPIVFPDEAAHPVKGTWSIRYLLLRCGEKKVYNTVFVAGGGDSPPTPHSYFPGATRAGTQLIRDVMPYALGAAKTRAGKAECRDIDVSDMAVSESPHEVTEGGTSHAGVWKEKWGFLICGQPVDIDLRFTPNDDGGTTATIEPKGR